MQPKSICDLRSAMRGKRRAMTRGGRATTTRRGRQATEQAAPASDVTVSPWVWFALCLFFFFFDKQICIAVLGNGVWFAFALYRLYLVFSANDVTVD